MNGKRLRPANLAGLGIAVAAAAISLAHAALPTEIVIPGERIFPESLTSTNEGAVIIGSIGSHSIFRAKPGAANAEVWIQAGTDGMQSIFGVLADHRSNTLWACSNSFGPPGGAGPPPSTGTLYAFDLNSGASKKHYPFPTAGSFCNDIAVARDGTVYATDTNNMEIVGLKKGASQLEVWAGNGTFGPKGGILDGISVLGGRILAGTLATSKLFSVPIEANGAPGTVVEVKLDRPIDRPDGIRPFGHDSLLVVESGGAGRLSRITLHENVGTVTMLKEGYPEGPVSVTVVGTTAYVLEGRLALLMRRPEDPSVAPDPRPFHATAVEVGRP